MILSYSNTLDVTSAFMKAVVFPKLSSQLWQSVVKDKNLLGLSFLCPLLDMWIYLICFIKDAIKYYYKLKTIIS